MKLFEHIEQIVRTPHGWCSRQKMQVLSAIIIATRPEFVVEVGIWSGKSFIPMALACREVNHGVCIGIDPWMAYHSVKGQSEADRKWWMNVNHEEIKRFFDQKLIEYDILNWVDIRRCTSDEYDPPRGIGLLHLDGNHGEQAIKDVERYAANVRVGGFAVLDDIHWSGEQVSGAMKRIKEFGFEELYRVEGPEQDTGMFNDWALFQRASK